ncbi:MAG: CotH kinase family protein [Eubacteriales bacterium]|nr:CotH kinase family protein [Bacillota bacterium]
MKETGLKRICTIVLLTLLITCLGASINMLRPKAEAPKAYAPVFSHESGWYKNKFNLSLSTKEPDAKIYYTLDGSIPDENSLLYTGPISIKNRTEQANTISEIKTAINNDNKPRTNVFKGNVIRARVYKDGYEPSDLVTHTYFVDKKQSDRYSFPVVSLVCDPDDLFDYERGIYVPGKIYDERINYAIPDYEREANYTQKGIEWERPVHIEFFETDGSLAFKLDAGIRIHGGATRATLQKSLRIYARAEYDKQNTIDYRIFPNATKADGSPLEKYKRLLLRNGGNDFWDSFFRDAFMQDLVAHTGLDRQSSRPAIVFINGEYWGIHNIRERIDDHYIANKYDIDTNRVVILEGDGWLAEGADGDELHYKNMIDFLYEKDISLKENYDYIKTQMDVDNYIDYQISQIYFANDDWPGNNIKFWRVRTDEYIEEAGQLDGRWRWILFDVDFGFGLYKHLDGYKHQTLSFAMQENGPDWPNPDWSTFLLRTLMKNEDFKQSFVNRFADHLNSSFSTPRVLSKINEFEKLYKAEMKEHIYRWNTMGSVNDWEDRVYVLKHFAEKRPGSMYSQLNRVLDLGGTSKLTLDCDDDKGYIKVNSISIKRGEVGIGDRPYPWTGMYFNQVPITLTAVPYEGNSFIGWEGDISEDLRDQARITLSLDQAISLTASFDGTGGSSSKGAGLFSGKGLVFIVPLALLILFGLVLLALAKRQHRL